MVWTLSDERIRLISAGRLTNRSANAMNANSDPDYNRYADLDFEDARPVAEVPALTRLQAEQGGKSRITIRVDHATLAVFRPAEMTGGTYRPR